MVMAKQTKIATSYLKLVDLLVENCSSNSPELAEILQWARSSCESNVSLVRFILCRKFRLLSILRTTTSFAILLVVAISLSTCYFLFVHRLIL